MSDTILRACLVGLLLVNIITAATTLVIARTIGTMLIANRENTQATADVRAAFLTAESRQAEALTTSAIESRRLSALICLHLQKIGKLEQPCPAP
jgi:hypothetical protein